MYAIRIVHVVHIKFYNVSQDLNQPDFRNIIPLYMKGTCIKVFMCYIYRLEKHRSMPVGHATHISDIYLCLKQHNSMYCLIADNKHSVRSDPRKWR